MAVACGACFQADRLIFLTDVEGVLDMDQKRLPRLTATDALALSKSGVVSGGMEAKLHAGMSGIAKTIGAVHIVAGSQPSILERVLNNEDVGTTLVRE